MTDILSHLSWLLDAKTCTVKGSFVSHRTCLLDLNESRHVLGDSRKRYRCPWAEVGKYEPRKEPILQDSLPWPLRKK